MKKMILIAAAVVFLAIAGVMAMSVTIIPQGHVAVEFNPMAGGVQARTRGQGLYFINPVSTITKFPVFTETVDVNQFDILTRDGKALALNMSYDFSVNPEYAHEIFDMFGGQSMNNIVSGWLEDRAMRSALAIFSSYSVLDVFSNLPSIQAQIFEEMRAITEEYGFVVRAVTIQAPQMDAQTAAAIQEVVNATQELERMEIERQQAEVQANIRIEEARGLAESVRIQAEAEAEANRLLERSLTDSILQLELINRWDGVLPIINGGDNGMFLDVSAILD